MIHLHILNRNALWSAYGTQVVDDDIWGAVAKSGKRRQEKSTPAGVLLLCLTCWKDSMYTAAAGVGY